MTRHVPARTSSPSVPSRSSAAALSQSWSAEGPYQGRRVDGRSSSATLVSVRPQVRVAGLRSHASAGVAPDDTRGKLATCDVRALQRVPVAVRVVSAAVEYAEHRFDAEVAVAHRAIARERRRAALDVETVVSRRLGDIPR